MCLRAAPTVMDGSRRTNSVVMIPPAVWSGYWSRRSISARTSALSLGSRRRRSCSPICWTMSVRSSAAIPSRTRAAREGSSFSRMVARRVMVGWSSTSTARGTGSIMMTLAASARVSWFSRSATSAAGRSLTTSPMPVKLSSSRSRMRSSSSSGAGTVSPPRGALLPTLLELAHQFLEARVAAEGVQLAAVREQRVVLVAQAHGPAHPLDGLVGHGFHAVEGGQPERDVVVGGGDLAHPIRDQGPGALVLAARAPTPGQDGTDAVQVRVLAQQVLQDGLRRLHVALVEEGHGQERAHQ